MITINQPQVTFKEGKARLEADIDIDGNIKNVWIEFDEKFDKYLCYERSDAFVIGILNYAIRNKHDITCKAPIGEELFYQLETILIEALTFGSDKMYKTRIIAAIDYSAIDSANAVGTGISCGIDSLHAISQHVNSKFTNHNITHLAYNNVGSHGSGQFAINLFNQRKLRAKKFAEEFKFEFIESNSNIYDVIHQDHLLTHTYTSTFAIYALQKLYSKYYYASSTTIFEFTIKNNHKVPSGHYDLLLTNSFSTNNLKIYSEGSTLTRLEKTKYVTEYTPSYTYLNVCLHTDNNCSRCEKCSRTLLALDALGKLELYNKVFDIDYFKRNKQDFYALLYCNYLLKNEYYAEIYPLLKNNIHLISKFKGIIKLIRPFILARIPKRIKTILKSLFKYEKNG